MKDRKSGLLDFESLSYPVITSDNFMPYLAGVFPEQGAKVIADKLDLGYLSPLLYRIYTEQNVVQVATPSTYESLGIDANSGNEMIDSFLIYDDLRKHGFSAESKAQGEIGTILYAKQNGTIWNTPLVKGEYSQVQLNYHEISEQMMKGEVGALMEIHRHPGLAHEITPFSIPDLRGILTKKSEFSRWVRSIVVINPGIIYLGVATNRTPLLTDEEFEAAIPDFRNTIEELQESSLTPERIAYNREVERLDDEFLDSEEEIIKKIEPHLEQLSVFQQKYNLSEEVVMDSIQAIMRQAYPEYHQRLEEIRKQFNVQGKYSKEAFEQALLVLPELLGIKVYMSSNFRSFIAFHKRNRPYEIPHII